MVRFKMQQISQKLPEAFFKSWASEACSTCSVGFVEAGLENELEPQLVSDRLNLTRHLQTVLLRLYHIGACHEEEWLRGFELLKQLGTL